MKLSVAGTSLALTAIAAPAQADAGDVLVRLRGIPVSPIESSIGITPSLPGDRVSVTDSIAPEIDFTWFATRNIGFELIAATTKHAVRDRDGLKDIGELVDTWVLPLP